jgi:alginate O-acetyltransferase complex protein AlgI
MLFNSHLFLLAFLPLSVALYRLIPNRDAVRVWYLVAVSLVFYGYWDVSFVPLLVVSVLGNWGLSKLYQASGRRLVPATGIALNLASLAYFKYAAFLVANLNLALNTSFAVDKVLLPLGISFFTFHNIMYLADLYRGKAPIYRLRDYALYIVFFPQIVAGPLVRHWELIPQIPKDPWGPDTAERLGRGLTLLIIGLVKKVLIADALAPLVNSTFTAAAQHTMPGLGDAWAAVLGFTFQIYFDFSGYSDMAIGIALMFGFALPFNFDAPYRSLSLRDFWRRWHMTLSRLLRDYLYIPFGGNRHGLPRQILALLGTMLLGGLWHGAAWTFVIWGGLHGIGLAAGVLWRRYLPPMPAVFSGPLTFAFVVFAWVFFRSGSIGQAATMFSAMAGAGGVHGARHLASILIAALIAFLGPTSQDVALKRLRPARWSAAAAALVLCIILLKLGDDTNYEFVYFQF